MSGERGRGGVWGKKGPGDLSEKIEKTERKASRQATGMFSRAKEEREQA